MITLVVSGRAHARRHLQPYLGAAGGPRPISSRPPTSIARSRIPPTPPKSCSAPRPRRARRRRPTARRAPFAAASDNAHAGRLRVADDVRQPLLRRAVDREVVLGRELRQVVGELVAHAQPAALREPGGQRRQRAAQPELVERLRPQPARDVARLLDRAARGLLHLLDRRLQRRRCLAREPSSSRTIPVSVWPSSSCSSRASRRRSRSCASSARRPLVRRSCSTRSSMSLNASCSSRTSATERCTSIRRPGGIGSTRRISAVSSRSGANTRRSARTLTASRAGRPGREHADLGGADARADRRGRQHERGERHPQHGRVDQGYTPQQSHPFRVARRRPRLDQAGDAPAPDHGGNYATWTARPSASERTPASHTAAAASPSAALAPSGSSPRASAPPSAQLVGVRGFERSSKPVATRAGARASRPPPRPRSGCRSRSPR